MQTATNNTYHHSSDELSATSSVATLYHCVGARSFRPLWVLEELQLDYELKMLAFPPRVCSSDFLSINPLGTVPAYVNGTHTMTESVAICQLLAAQHSPRGLNVEADEYDYGLFLDLLHFGESTLTFPHALILRYGQFEPNERKLPQVVEDYTSFFLGRLRKLDFMFAERDFLCAGRLTVADISISYALLLAQYVGMLNKLPENVRRYWEGMRNYPSFLQALSVEEAAAAEQGVSTVPVPLL
ncbi:MAG: glutathione S-transferase family protein [Burkholderiaceae bacterium]|nr:glutathione S-transferase family protein [Burkholderiaceae bacterium]